MSAANSASPCVKVCVIDAVTGFCVGCGRTGTEIGAWMSLSEAQKITLNASLPSRMQAISNRNARCLLPKAGRIS